MRVYLPVAAALVLMGCQHEDLNTQNAALVEMNKQQYLESKSKQPDVDLTGISNMFEDYNVILPNGNRIRICSAYNCTHKQVYRLSPALLIRARKEISGAKTAQEEREGLARALQVVEQGIGPDTGTDSDQQGGPVLGTGNTGQLNHVDEALNTTSILLVIYRYNLINFHDLERPQFVEGTQYPIIRDRETGNRFGIDTGYRPHAGEVKIFNVRDGAP